MDKKPYPITMLPGFRQGLTSLTPWQEKVDADKKYSALSYDNYFKQYVEPLVPGEVAKINAMLASKNPRTQAIAAHLVKPPCG